MVRLIFSKSEECRITPLLRKEVKMGSRRNSITIDFFFESRLNEFSIHYYLNVLIGFLHYQNMKLGTKIVGLGTKIVV